MTDKTQQLRYRDLLKKLVVLSIPTMIEEILATLMQYVDTAMVGHLGEKATASVSVTTTIGWLVGSMAFAMGSAILALISQAYGAKDREKGSRLAGQALFLTIIIGIVLGVISIALSPFIPGWMGAEKAIRSQASLYFTIISIPMVFRVSSAILGSAVRATQNTKTPMLISMFSNLLNVVLNYLLIYTAGLGVTGAAIGSAISFTIGGFLMFMLFMRTEFFFPKRPAGQTDSRGNAPAGIREMAAAGIREKTAAGTSEKNAAGTSGKIPAGTSGKAAAGIRGGYTSGRISIRPDRSVLADICRIGIPVMGTSVVSTLGYVVFAGMVSGMGTTIFAAHSIAVTAEEIFYIPGYGLRTATSALVGAAIGEGNERKFKIYCRIAVSLTVSMMFLSGLVLFFTAQPLMSLFTPSQEVIRIGSEMLKLVAFSEPFFGLMVVMQGILYGMGRTKYAFWVEAISMWGVRILFTSLVVYVWHLSLREVWYCMIACNVTKAVLLTLPFLMKGHGWQDVKKA